MRSYYSADMSEFLGASIDHILAEIVVNDVFDLDDLQRDAWAAEISVLKNELLGFDEGLILLF